MSRTIVGYEGDGKHRRPIYADQGAASGRGRGGTPGIHAEVAAIAQAEASRLVEVGGRMPDGGAGKIERSMATEAQREAWRAADATAVPMRIPVQAKLENDGVHAKGTPEERAVLSKARQADHRARAEADRPAMGSREHLQASRMRGAARHLEVVGAGRVDPEPRRSIAVTARPVTPQEEPAMAIEPPPEPPVEQRSHLEQDPPATLGTRIGVVAEAAAAASDAWSELQMAAAAERAAEAALAAAEMRWDDARAALEASWRSTGIGFADARTPSEAERRHHELLETPASPPASPVVESGADHAESIPGPTDAGGEDPGVARANVPTGVLADVDDELADDAPAVVTRRAEADPTAQPAAAFAAFSRDKAASAGARPALSASQERLLSAVGAANGNLKDAAAALGITGQGVQTSLRHIGEKGGIPVELIPLLPAGYAKYRPAGL